MPFNTQSGRLWDAAAVLKCACLKTMETHFTVLRVCSEFSHSLDEKHKSTDKTSICACDIGSRMPGYA